MSYVSAVLADSPVIFLQLDETTGTSAADSGSNGVAWTYQSGVKLGVTPVFAIPGTAITPPGTTPAAVLASPPASVANPRGTSVEISVNIPNTSLKGQFVDLGSGSNGWSVGVGSGTLDTAGNNLIVLQENVAWYDTGVKIGTGAHHVIVTNDTSGTITCYLDGNLVKTFTNAQAPSTATAFNLAGVGSRSLPSTVAVDNLAVFATVLTQTQVSAHWNALYTSQPYVNAELSNTSLEVVAASTVVKAELSNTSLEVIVASLNPPRVISSASREVLSANASPPRVVSSVTIEALTVNASAPRVISSVTREVLTPSALLKFTGWGVPIIG